MNEGQTPRGLASAVGSALRDPRMVLGAAAALFLFLSMALVPVLGVFLGIFTPLPLLYFYCQRGRVFGLTMIGLAALGVGLVYALAARPLGVIFFLEYALLAAVMAEAFRLGLSPGRVVGYPAGAVLTLGLVLLTLSGLARGQSPWAFGRTLVREQIQASVEMYDRFSTGRPSSAPSEEPAADQPPTPVAPPAGSSQELGPMGRGLVRVFPGLMIMGTLLVSWVNFMTGRRFLAGAGSLPPALSDLKRWQAPEGTIWVLIASGFALILPLGGGRTLGLNALLVLGLVYFFQGLSVVAYWLDRKAAPLFLKVVTYGLIALQQYLALVVAGLGVFDMWFDFRRLKKA